MPNSGKSFPFGKYFILIATFLLLVIFLNYANSLFSPFLLDDYHVFVHNPQVKNNTFFQLSTIHYRHFFYSTFALNYYWGGLDPFGYHLFNILLHFLTTLLAFFISFITAEKGLLCSKKAAFKIAFLTSLFFALNPVHTETVTYISGRGSGLAAFFYFSSLLLFLVGSIKFHKTLFPMPLLFLLSLAAWVMAFGSKEIAITLPAIIILYEFSFMRTGKWVDLRFRIIYYYLPLPLFTAAFLIKYSPESLSFIKLWLNKIDFTYALIQSKLLSYALKIHFFPINLAFDYDFPNSFYHGELLFTVVFFIIVFFYVKKTFHQKLAVLPFSFLWYLIIMSPTNSVLPRVELFNERNLYLPSFGLSFFFAVLIYSLSIYNRKRPVLFLSILSILMMIFTLNSALLIKRNSVYRTEILLWKDTLKKSPGKARPLNNLSKAYLSVGDYEKAQKGFNQVLISNPYDYYAHVNLGKIYADTGKLEKAKNEFQEAIKSNPDSSEAYFNLGAYYASKGNFTSARREMTKGEQVYSIATQPDFYLNKAKIDIKLNRLAEAEKGIKKFLRFFPGLPQAHFLLGQVYSQQGKIKSAVKEYEKSKGDKYFQARAHNNVGLIYIEQNRFNRAIIELNKALSINPDFLEAHFNLGRLFMEVKGDTKKARTHFKRALELKPEQKKVAIIKKMLLQLNN